MDLYEEGDSRGDKGGGARAGEQCVFGCFHGFRAESTSPLSLRNHQPLYVVVVRGVAVREDLDSERVVAGIPRTRPVLSSWRLTT